MVYIICDTHLISFTTTYSIKITHLISLKQLNLFNITFKNIFLRKILFTLLLLHIINRHKNGTNIKQTCETENKD